MLSLLQPPSFLSLFFFFFFFFFFFISSKAPTCLSQDDSPYYTACAPLQFPCGGKTYEINYPFRVDDPLRPEYCSYPGYNLTCVDNRRLVAEALSRNFSIKSINYETDVLEIFDEELTSSDCPRPSRNSTLDPFSIEFTIRSQLLKNHIAPNFDFFPFNYTRTVQNVTLYHNCTHPIQRIDDLLRPFQCLTSDGNYSYLALRPPVVSEWFRNCNDPVIIPLFRTAAERLLEDDGAKYGDILKSGFDVEWMAGTEWCSKCERSGGRCGYNYSEPMEPTCFCRNGEQLSTCPSKKNRIVLKVIIGVSTAICSFFLASFVYIVFACRRKLVKRENNTYGHNNMEVLCLWRHPINNVEAFLQSYGSLAPRRFRYSELKKMTNSFKDKLGQGGYGGVFKGQLKDGRLVAVKVLNKSKGNGEEFINEVASIGGTNHVNVVSLLGFCYERSMRALIYEFMSNGSLEKFIYSDKSVKGRILECEKLFKIAIGIARGLEYLHRGCTICILHFDIKPHNILLDDNFCPKISDFGLAKLCPEHESVVSMHDARGTMGYIAPEVYCRNIGVASYKSDVYSYGMMVLEMVAGRKNIDAGVDNTSEMYFPHWIYNRVDLQESLELLGIDDDADKEIARKMVLVGLWCIQTDPTNRPSMSKVVEMLEGNLENLQMPPKP